MSQPTGLRRGALPLARLAEKIRDAIMSGDEKTAWRWVIGFLDDFRGSSPQGSVFLVSEPPAIIGDARYDATLAALAEHLCTEAGLPIPSWTWEDARMAKPWWFPAGLPGFEAMALRDSPIAFKRHGVFLTERALDRV